MYTADSAKTTASSPRTRKGSMSEKFNNLRSVLGTSLTAAGDDELDLPIKELNSEYEQNGCASPKPALRSGGQLQQGVSRCRQRVRAHSEEDNMGGGDIPDLGFTSVANLSQRPMGVRRCLHRVHAQSEEANELDSRNIETNGVREPLHLPPRLTASHKSIRIMGSFLFVFRGFRKMNLMNIDNPVAEDGATCGARHYYEKMLRTGLVTIMKKMDM